MAVWSIERYAIYIIKLPNRDIDISDVNAAITKHKVCGINIRDKRWLAIRLSNIDRENSTLCAGYSGTKFDKKLNSKTTWGSCS